MTSFLDTVNALLEAARENRLDFISDLLSKDGTLAIASNYDGVSALHVASGKGHKDLVKFLLKKGANVHSRTVDGATALCEACGNGQSEIADLLLTHGSLLNPPCQMFSPLHEAAANGRESICHMLIKNGAKINATDCWYGTPLHAACYRGQTEAAAVLLSAGANVNATKIHATPLHFAVEQNPENVRLAALLISYGANVYARDNQGLKPSDLLLGARDKRGDQLLQLLQQTEQNPRSLKETCKITIVGTFGEERILNSPLPQRLKSYLTTYIS